MREDIIGMLKNAIDHGGNPLKIAQSLINSGYPMKDVREAYDYVVQNLPKATFDGNKSLNKIDKNQSNNKISNDSQNKSPGTIQVNSYNSQETNQQVNKNYPNNYSKISTKDSMSELKPLKPLPSARTNPSGTGKIIVMVIILLILVLSLVTVIIFKDKILDIFSL